MHAYKNLNLKSPIVMALEWIMFIQKAFVLAMKHKHDNALEKIQLKWGMAGHSFM